MAGWREIEDGQLPMRERKPSTFTHPYPGIIRAAVDEGICHAAGDILQAAV
jgi:hypothetical protein